MSNKLNNKVKIRVQPKDLKIPKANPFEHDLLNRKESVQALTNLLRSIESPCVFSIDSGWGSGKTTFLKIWSQYLRNKEFVVIDFNAWESDYSEDPFAALTGELMDGIEKHFDDNKNVNDKGSLDEFKMKAKELWQITQPALLRFISAGGLGSGIKVLAETFELSDLLESNKTTVKEFKKSFKLMIKTITATNQLPLIVMIDELDRCRPSYAIELLEVAKHLFSVNGVMFVLAINHSQLSHSVKMLYGQSFDAHGYLKRFIDVDFKLPSPKREDFVRSLVDSFEIKRIQIDSGAQVSYRVIQSLLVGFLSNSNLSLREIAKAISRLGLILGSLPDDQIWISPTVAVVLVLRTIDPEGFDVFYKGEISDADFAESVFKLAGASEIRTQEEGRIFEWTVILGALEIRNQTKLYWNLDESKLLQRYRTMIENSNSSSEFDRISDSQRELLGHAARIVNIVSQKNDENRFNSSAGVGFLQSVEHFEFVASTFAGE